MTKKVVVIPSDFVTHRPRLVTSADGKSSLATNKSEAASPSFDKEACVVK